MALSAISSPWFSVLPSEFQTHTTNCLQASQKIICPKSDSWCSSFTKTWSFKPQSLFQKMATSPIWLFWPKCLIQCDPLSFTASYLRVWVFTVACHALYGLVSGATVTHLLSLLNLFLVWTSRNVSTSGSLHLYLLPLPCWQLITPISALFFSLVFSTICYTLFFILHLSLSTH